MRAHVLAGSFAVLLATASGVRAQSEPPPAPDQMETPARNGTRDVAHAAAAPLHDLNLTRQTVPPLLLAAIANPYLPPSPATCRNLDAMVAELDDVLGPDFDLPETPQDPSLNHKTRSVGLALAHGAAESLLPFSGYVRTLSGAERHDQLVVEAITAGSVRRGYLKGLGEAHNCPDPARPRRLAAPRLVPDMSMKPMYPIR